MTFHVTNLSARFLTCALTVCLASLACLAGCALPKLEEDPPVPVLEFEPVCLDSPEANSPGSSHNVTIPSGLLVYTWPSEDSQDYPLGHTEDSSLWLLDGIWEDDQQLHMHCSADGDCTETHPQWLRMSAVVQGCAVCGLQVWLPLHSVPPDFFPDSWHEVAKSLPKQSLTGWTGEQGELPTRLHYSADHAIHRPSSFLDLHLCPHPRCPKLRPTIEILSNRLLVVGATTSTDGTEWYMVNTGGKSSTVWVDSSQVDIRILPRATRLLNKYAKDGAVGFLHGFYLAADSGTPHLRLPALLNTRGTHAICLVDDIGKPLMPHRTEWCFHSPALAGSASTIREWA